MKKALKFVKVLNLPVRELLLALVLAGQPTKFWLIWPCCMRVSRGEEKGGGKGHNNPRTYGS